MKLNPTLVKIARLHNKKIVDVMYKYGDFFVS